MAIYTKQFWYLELEQHIQLRAGLSEVQRPTKHIHLRASGCSKERPSLSKNYSQWQNKPSHQKTSIITGTRGQHEAHCCVFSPTLPYRTQHQHHQQPQHRPVSQQQFDLVLVSIHADIPHFTMPPRSTQPGHSSVSRHNEYQQKLRVHRHTVQCLHICCFTG